MKFISFVSKNKNKLKKGFPDCARDCTLRIQWRSIPPGDSEDFVPKYPPLRDVF
jgi:hypothetical protein